MLTLGQWALTPNFQAAVGLTAADVANMEQYLANLRDSSWPVIGPRHCSSPRPNAVTHTAPRRSRERTNGEGAVRDPAQERGEGYGGGGRWASSNRAGRRREAP